MKLKKEADAIWITAFRRTETLSWWSANAGLSKRTIKDRLKRGLTAEQSLHLGKIGVNAVATSEPEGERVMKKITLAIVRKERRKALWSSDKLENLIKREYRRLIIERNPDEGDGPLLVRLLNEAGKTVVAEWLSR
jgi:hypothetical protein